MLLNDEAGRLCASIVLLTRGRFAVISEVDEADVTLHKWCFHHAGYAVRSVARPGGRSRCGQKMLLMHREIHPVPDGFEVDHKNGNRLDNRRQNLRQCSVSQNQQNRRSTPMNTSGFRGVHWAKHEHKWKAAIRVDGRKVHLGYHLAPEDAARAYDRAAVKYFGEFAVCNFPTAA